MSVAEIMLLVFGGVLIGVGIVYFIVERMIQPVESSEEAKRRIDEEYPTFISRCEQWFDMPAEKIRQEIAEIAIEEVCRRRRGIDQADNRAYKLVAVMTEEDKEE